MKEELCREKINKATRVIARVHPYYIPFTIYSRYILNRAVPTMCIDGGIEVQYNDIFLAELTDQELVTVLLHEFKHVEHNHHARMAPYANKVSHKALNIAADMEINTILKEKGCKNFLRGRMVLPEDFGYEPLKTMEYYLNNMLRDGNAQNVSMQCGGGGGGNQPQQNDGNQPQPQPQNNNGQDPGNGEGSNHNNGPLSRDQNKFSSDCKPDNKTSNEPMSENKLEELLNECREAEKNAGNQSCITSEGLLKPKKIPFKWDEILKNIIISTAKKCDGDEYITYSRLHRRTMAEMACDEYDNDRCIIVRPSYFSYEYKIRVAIIFDVSGSMYNEKAQVYGVLRSIKDKMSDESSIDITIYETDTEVINVINDFDPDLPIHSVNGGGTYMPAGWNYIIDRKEDRNYDLVLCMTDGYTGWDSKAPLKSKSVVLYTENNDGCPYKNYLITFGKDDLTK